MLSLLLLLFSHLVDVDPVVGIILHQRFVKSVVQKIDGDLQLCQVT